LCQTDGGLIVARTPAWRLVRATDTPEHPAFYRLIAQAHVAEFSDLSGPDRHALMDAVAAVERTLREALAPTKVNLASLGNVVPHLHWHVIARFADDAQFPAPIWAPAVRQRDATVLAALQQRLAAVDEALRAALVR
jgi:diadenosine tetraphosphate (Ap4A) HIT family hydrolase